MKTSDSDQILFYHRCRGRGNRQDFVNSGEFRENPNGKSIDMRLIYRCKHIWNLTIYEKTKPGKIPTELSEAFQDHDAETAMAYGRDIVFVETMLDYSQSEY